MNYVFESPDHGKTIYRRKVGELARERIADDFPIDELIMAGLEEEAAKMEVTVDYFMDEFL